MVEDSKFCRAKLTGQWIYVYIYIDMYMCTSMYMYMCIILYLATKNKANQNTGKPLHIRRHYTKSSHRALRSYSGRVFVGGDISGLFQVFIYFQAASLRYFSRF